MFQVQLKYSSREDRCAFCFQESFTVEGEMDINNELTINYLITIGQRTTMEKSCIVRTTNRKPDLISSLRRK